MLLYRPDLVGTDKRTRQKELHRTRLEQAKKEAASQARRRRIINIVGAVVFAVLVAVAVAFFTKDDDKTVTTADGSTTVVPTTLAEGASTTVPEGGQAATLVGPGPGESVTGATPCPAADGSSPRTTSFTEAPPMCIDPAKTYTATFETSKGKMLVALDAATAPKTVNNFVVLSRYHFYDNTPFFRIVPDFAAQFGDPSAAPSNAAQFGYNIPDELPEKGKYQVGSLAMANAGPDTGGAQMFFVTGEQGAALDPNYALFGQVTEGLETLAAINAVPSVQTDTNDGAPTEQVNITSITINES